MAIITHWSQPFLNMTTCHRCQTDFENHLLNCPSCGASNERDRIHVRPKRRCSDFAYFFLKFAQIATLLGLFLCLLVGVLALLNAEFAKGLVHLLILAPIAAGQFVMFGLVAQFANEGPALTSR
jgi:hypothetical protein